MKLREISLKNFRCFKDITIPIDDITVLIGENNSGKTALLEAIRFVLPPRFNQSNPFEEYDYHMTCNSDSPQTSDGIAIELLFKEDITGEWPDSLIQALSEIVQTEPIGDIDSIRLKISSKYDEATSEIVPKWEFLDLANQPLGGKGGNINNHSKFLSYIKFFYLSALRDSSGEFSPRSQYWGKILKNMKISEEHRQQISDDIVKLNESLLKEDPRLLDVISALDGASKTMTSEAESVTSIQALPLRIWELMGKSEVVIKSKGTETSFPMARHGQGIQSLSVVYLFQAYIDVMLKPTFKEETEAILALEEPEAHLHPQATRAFSLGLDKIKGQKIISSHSPYFIQEIPFPNLRVFKKNGNVSRVLYIKRSFFCNLPKTAELERFCLHNTPKYQYDNSKQGLVVYGRIEQQEYRDLLTAFQTNREYHPVIKSLREESELYLSDEELGQLGSYAKRIRGEILFARAFLLCEGQCEYMLLRYFSELMNTPLDNSGVSVIDFQNNGSPGAFVGLAKVFDIPWIMTCDNDEAGKGFIEQIKKRVVTEIDKRAIPLPGENTDLEIFLINNGFLQDYVDILSVKGISLSKKQGDVGFEEEVAAKLRNDKPGHIISLIRKLKTENANASRIPKFYHDILSEIVKIGG